MMEEWGLEASEREARSNDEANAPTMTGRQKWSLAVFAFTFVVMIVGFVPWGSFGIDVFDAGAAYEEVVTPVTGEEITAAYDEANGTVTTLEGEVAGEAVITEEISPAWPPCPHGHSSGRLVLRRSVHLVSAHDPCHRNYRRHLRGPLRPRLHQRRC